MFRLGRFTLLEALVALTTLAFGLGLLRALDWGRSPITRGALQIVFCLIAIVYIVWRTDDNLRLK